MYHAHPNQRLRELFAVKPYQGADPATARFLFFGLDANYHPAIDERPYFSEIVAYLEDGVRYWKQRGFHHPFRHPDYRGDGALYHRRFSEIGFTTEHAAQVSFVELVDVPTYGRSALKHRDLPVSHVARLSEWVLSGKASYVFIPPGVGNLLRSTQEFAWLPKLPSAHQGSLPVLWASEKKIVFAPFHFSCVGWNCLKKDRDQQLQDIGKLIH
jgi:hypothetical protein